MRVSWVLLGILGMLTLCWGYAFDRSVPIEWDKIPVLENNRTGLFEKILDGKIQVTGMDKILQASEAKKSIKEENELIDDPFREKRSELLALENQTNRKTKGLEEAKDDFIFPIEENSSLFPKDEPEKPRNVILLFIDESGQDRGSLWASLKTSNSFPVQGFLQSCRNEGKGLRNPMYETLFYGPNYQCECEIFLRTNVASLLDWAHRAKEMTTGTVSATNFSIPSALGYESPISNQNSEELGETKMKIFGHQLHDDWHLIDLNKDGISSAFPSVSSTPKQEGKGMWNIFNTFSKIRIAFFRKWLESLHENALKTEDEFFKRNSIPLEANLVELMGDTVEKLKSIAKDKGFIMVAAAPGNQISPAIEILQKEVSSVDTLLVVAGICSQDIKLVPFFARGPGAKYLFEAKSIWDLPSVVKKAVAGGCQGIWCKMESPNSIWDSGHEFHRRFARGKPNDKIAVNSTTTPNLTTEAAKVSNQTKVSTEKSTERSTEKPTEKSAEKSTQKSSKKPTEKPIEKKVTENLPVVKETSESENSTKNVEVDTRMDTSGASRFSTQTTSTIIGVMTSFAATIFLDF